jgi:hypothetical protein
MPALPGNFSGEGLLPPGDYETTFEALRSSLLVAGPPASSPWGEGWDARWREHLTRQAETLARQLWRAGIGSVYLDGSFTEAKTYPNDIDGYFAVDVRRVATGRLERELNALDAKSC